MKISEIAARIGGEVFLNGQLDCEISDIRPIEKAGPGELSFLANMDYERYLTITKAGVVILSEKQSTLTFAQIIHKNPYLAFAKAAQLFQKNNTTFTGVHSLAYVDPTAELGKDITILPFAFVGKGAKIGPRVFIHSGAYIGEFAEIEEDSTIMPHVFIGERVRLGKRVLVHANAVIGGDGFGFAVGENEIVKVPQTGTVVLEDDVEVGPLTSIDRAALDVTRIGRGTKLDSKVHIGHNVQVGKHCMFAAFTGIAGSTRIGDWVLMGGHSGTAGHIEIADRTKIAGMTGVTNDTETNVTYTGFPAIPAPEWRRLQVHQRKLPEYAKMIKNLEKRIADLEQQVSASTKSSS
jgi:UDP-3-O-[3-hydroxymyristoyl] glucosamine N-acyltransferase